MFIVTMRFNSVVPYRHFPSIDWRSTRWQETIGAKGDPPQPIPPVGRTKHMASLAPKIDGATRYEAS